MKYGAILADPPWRFATWDKREAVQRGPDSVCHYNTMTSDDLRALPVGDLAADDCALFLWAVWPMLEDALQVMSAWGFTYKTCAFDWMKAHAGQIDMLRDDLDASMGMGYWTRANSEPCLLGVRGKPKRQDRGVRMGIIEPRREHSRKPDCVRKRIERLVSGPYVELFARSSRPGWDVRFSDEAGKFDSTENVGEPAAG